ncbi:MAG: ATP-binding protein [Spirochaetales bacterium]|nr:ATP-binding protein [Spirochaetales bacterium]
MSTGKSESIFRRFTLTALLIHTLFTIQYGSYRIPLIISASSTFLYALLVYLPLRRHHTRPYFRTAYLVNLYPFLFLLLFLFFQNRLYRNQLYVELGLSLMLVTAAQFLNNRKNYGTILLTVMAGWLLFLSFMGALILLKGVDISASAYYSLWNHFFNYIFLCLSLGISAYLSFRNLRFRLEDREEKEKNSKYMEILTRESRLGLFLMDLKEDRILANNSFYQLLAIDQNIDNIPLQTLVDNLISPDDLNMARGIVEDLKAKKAINLPVDLKLNYKDREKWFRFDGTFSTKEGEEDLFLASLTDIDDMIQQNRRLDQSFIASNFVPWSWDRELGMTFFDKNYTHLLGIPVDKHALSQRDFFNKIVHGDDRKEMVQFFSSLSKKGLGASGVDTARFRLRFTPLDDYIWVEGRIIEMKSDHNGFPLQVEGIFRNITLEKEREEQLGEEKREREVANMKNSIISRLSHELLTPMNGIMGMADQLEHSELGRAQRNILDKLNASSALLLNRIHELLDITDLTQSSVSLKHDIFSPARLIEELVDSQMNGAQANGIKLILETPSPLPPYLKGDRSRISQIILNLIKNGLKFTPRGKVTVKAEIRETTENNCRLRISVKDEGIGIPEEKLALIFEPFGQLDSSTQRERGGIGLSLAINKQLVEIMGGMMGVKSSPGEGSEFYIELPFLLGKEEEAQSRKSHPVVPGSRILIVDDNPLNREIAADLLALRKGEVITAAGGREGLDAINELSPHLVFLDIQMPGMDGYTMARLQREREKDQNKGHTPIIALTANFTEEDKKLAYQAGMDGYLTKPVNLPAIDRVLEKWLEPFLSREDSSNESPEEHPPIPGIALDETLERFGGEYHLLLELLKDYLEDYRDFPGKMEELYEKKDFKAIHQSTHALKGVSGSLGIEDVFTHSGNLCNKYIRSGLFEREDLSILAGKMARFQKKLNHFLNQG